MVDIPRRTVDELLARYTLEPNLRDVYVEGDLDRRILEWFFSKIKAIDVKVYEINSVEIPSDIVPALRGATGNKGRLIALCNVLEREIIEDLNIICLIDLDFDEILNRVFDCKYILSTDYPGIEIYLFNHNILEKFFLMVFGKGGNTTERFLEDVVPILQSLYVVRVTKEVLAPSMVWVDHSRCLRVDGGRLLFDWEEYVRRTLNANDWPVTEEQFLNTAAKYRNSLPANPVHSIHGHDLTLVTCNWINKLFRTTPQIRDREVLGGLTAAIELENLTAEVMFQKIERFCVA